MRTRINSSLRYLLVLAAIPGLATCSLKNEIQAAASGCDEFNGGGDAVAALSLNVSVKAFAQAAAELRVVGDGLKNDVKLACIHICTDLGETDRWSGDGSDGSISNDQGSGACDVANTRINAIMTAGASAGANFALQISGGECTVDTTVQTNCEQSCAPVANCTEPSVETRCTPGEVTGVCDTECVASATCEGHADVAANCMGECESECEGSCNGEVRGRVEGGCDGMCEGSCDGVRTPRGGMANCAGVCEGKCSMPKAGSMCHGKCNASCHGTCKGRCKIEASASVNCGASVRCKGGCTTTVTEPKCESEITPAVCVVDPNCTTSCSAQASSHTTCTGPSLTLVCDTDASVDTTGDIVKLKGTLEANLPAILLAANTKGPLAARALDKVSATGQAVINATAHLGGKDVACAATAATASVKAALSVHVSVNASASVNTSCSSHSG